MNIIITEADKSQIINRYLTKFYLDKGKWVYLSNSIAVFDDGDSDNIPAIVFYGDDNTFISEYELKNAQKFLPFITQKDIEKFFKERLPKKLNKPEFEMIDYVYDVEEFGVCEFGNVEFTFELLIDDWDMLYVQLLSNETKYDLLFDEKLSDKIFTLIIKSYKKIQ